MTDTELEQRLIQARPVFPEPPRTATERARAATLAALTGRRRRRGLTLVVAAAIALGALAVPAALGIGGDLLDLLPLGGEKEDEQFRASCEATTIRLTFDPAKGAAVTSGNETLAFAGFGRHEIAESCTTLPAERLTSPYSASAFENLPDEGVYRATTLVCTVPAKVEINAHPIWDRTMGRVGGSVLLVLRGDPPRALISAVLKEPDPTASPGTSRIYYEPGICRRG
ncbi:MAG: hypothetical protein MSC30_10895 [Gaiellaceae bacterium MAG52_C11]|nr:hypothetical protein [Candidatus Gaiellasilicea maunaloa]